MVEKVGPEVEGGEEVVARVPDGKVHRTQPETFWPEEKRKDSPC